MQKCIKNFRNSLIKSQGTIRKITVNRSAQTLWPPAFDVGERNAFGIGEILEKLLLNAPFSPFQKVFQVEIYCLSNDRMVCVFDYSKFQICALIWSRHSSMIADGSNGCMSMTTTE
jgi:hypothetical protein